MTADTPRPNYAERLEQIREFVSPADTITDRVFLLQQIDIRDTEIAGLRAEVERLREAVQFAHGWISGLPREPSFEDKRAAQVALEGSGAIWPHRQRLANPTGDVAINPHYAREPAQPVRRDWCEEHNRGSLAETDGLCPDCEKRSAVRRNQQASTVAPPSISEPAQPDIERARELWEKLHGYDPVEAITENWEGVHPRLRAEFEYIGAALAAAREQGELAGIERGITAAETIQTRASLNAQEVKQKYPNLSLDSLREIDNRMAGQRHAAREIATALRALLPATEPKP